MLTLPDGKEGENVVEGNTVPLFDLVMCLSEASDLISPQVSNHHKQVAFIASEIAKKATGASDHPDDIIIAALVHDVGAMSLSERLDDLQFEADNQDKHALAGWLLLKEFEPLHRMAPMVRFHNQNWIERDPETEDGQIQLGGEILHLAEHVSALIHEADALPEQAGMISRRIREQSGSMFNPELVDVFLDLAKRDYFWLDAVSPSISSILARTGRSSTVQADEGALLRVTKMFSNIVDFRSPFTATHSAGVAACAEALARLAGLSDRLCTLMRAAGYLHDLGKLSVPSELLDKPGPLAGEESKVVQAHAYYTCRILENVEPLREVSSWASLHHERVDGTGYPFKLAVDDLDLPDRIMAVADAFTALTENRPYRGGADRYKALEIVRQMAHNGTLDSGVVSLLEAGLDEVYFFSLAAQSVAAIEYRQFQEGLASQN